MNKGKYVFAQLAEFLPLRVFDGFVAKYIINNPRWRKSVTCTA